MNLKRLNEIKEGLTTGVLYDKLLWKEVLEHAIQLESSLKLEGYVVEINPWVRSRIMRGDHASACVVQWANEHYPEHKKNIVIKAVYSRNE